MAAKTHPFDPNGKGPAQDPAHTPQVPLEMARCGLDCGRCDWRERMQCPGCQAAGGHMFHGDCPVALCSIAKGLLHCGACADLPCDILTRYAFDPEHGDPQGSRIQVLRQWQKK